MALFRYQALSERGKKYKGLIDAENMQDAKSILTQKKIILTDLFELTPKEKKIKFTKSEIIHFTQELAKLLRAGMPLYECLLALEEKYQNTKMHSLVLDLCSQIQKGIPLSEAMASHGHNFDFLYCSMIANGEKTGSMEASLNELSDLLSKQNMIKRKLIASLLYPGIICSFSLIVIFALLFFVIPSLFELFEGRTLHPLTQVVLSCSHFACEQKFYLFSGFMAFIGLGSLCIVSKGLKSFFFRITLQLPFINHLMTKVALIRFSRALSTLLLSGVSYLDALELGKKVVTHPFLAEDITYAKNKVAEGSSLSSELKKSKYVPALVSRMISIAEESGKMSQMLDHIAEIYEEDLEKTLAQITTMLQPFILLVLGLFVGFVVLAVLLPLTDVSSFLDM